jgi:hypothetical protein
MTKLFFILLLLSVKVSAQENRNNNTKAGWSAKEKSDFIESCIRTAIGSMSEGKARAYCTCMQQKMEIKYPDTKSLDTITEEIMQTPEMKAMMNSCLPTDSIEAKANDDSDKVFTKVEIEAAFPGGDAAWRRYLEKYLQNFNPADNGAPFGSYTVRIQFIVDKEGKISNVTALTHYGFGMEEIAIKVIKNGPKWTPAIQHGRNVKAFRTQPISFQIQSQ